MTRTAAWAAGALALFAALSARPQAAAEAPDAIVKSAMDEVIAAVRQMKDPREFVELAERKIVAYFEFRTMTRLAVGRSWAQASEAQRQALEKAFRTLLVRTYATAVLQASDQAQVEVKPTVVKPGETEAIVRTVVSEAGRQPFSIDYRMMRTNEGWKVYDVVVENLSLVTNYRGSFASEISRSGIDGLIKVIEERNRRLAEKSV